jgi:sulfur carrier protein ThiS
MAVGVFVGALARGAMADILGESPQSEQVLLASVDQEFVPEGNWAGTDWQISGPVEIVAIPVMVSEESWMKEYGND